MFWENIKEAITSISSNKMRSLLTMLGIIIGISSVIIITTIGGSIQSTLTATMNSLGGNMVQAYVEARYPENDEDWATWEQPDMTDSDYVTQDMIDGLIEKYPDEVTGVAAQNYLGSGTIKDDADSKNYANVNIDGITPEYLYNQALFGKVDTSIPEKDRVTELMIPLQTCFKLQGTDRTGYDYFNLMIDPLADVNQATTDVLSYFDEVYANNKNFHVSAYNMASDLGMINTVLNVITIAVSGIAAISLIVGGVGVMNIMLVSITERTREIGVRMALGAKRRTIRTQFVIEAIMLCLIGGIIGILIGVGIGALLGKVAGFVIQNMYSQYANYIIMTVHPSVTAIMLSLFFSMLTGVLFGYYPANKASKMEVIDALRYE